ncbi:hypothetical protein B0H10DRAFT_2439397 [Mycena sp. CBHHK59/15]|nr:hypothetical protein B0H10DRAFT_2439397 [Mycena sp. CBHHK59/15]
MKGFLSFSSRQNLVDGARSSEEQNVTKKYYPVLAMILESGALLCTVAILYLALMYTEKGSTRVMCAALSQLAGIALTIIAV